MLIEAGKYHCFGNDFLVVEALQLDSRTFSQFAVAVCDRHFGVGADGCLFVDALEDGEFGLHMFNPDGSEFGMTGNGVRCVSAHLLRRRLTPGPEVVFHTLSGVKRYELVAGAEPTWTFRSRMGKPLFEPAQIPFVPPEDHLEEVMDYPLEVAGERVRVHALNVGNPQCVVVVQELPGEAKFRKLGAALEVHPSFPERANISFLKVESEKDIRIRIWERGVGPTHSSGTGSCGAAVAALARGLVGNPVTVHTRTGRQVVQWRPGEEIELVGDCVFVAEIRFEWMNPSGTD